MPESTAAYFKYNQYILGQVEAPNHNQAQNVTLNICTHAYICVCGVWCVYVHTHTHFMSTNKK